MAVDRPIRTELAGRAHIRKITRSAGFRSVRYTYDGLLTCTPTSSLQRKPHLRPEPDRRLHVAFVNPGIARAEPRAVTQGQLQES